MKTFDEASSDIPTSALQNDTPLALVRAGWAMAMEAIVENEKETMAAMVEDHATFLSRLAERAGGNAGQRISALALKYFEVADWMRQRLGLGDRPIATSEQDLKSETARLRHALKVVQADLAAHGEVTDFGRQLIEVTLSGTAPSPAASTPPPAQEAPAAAGGMGETIVDADSDTVPRVSGCKCQWEQGDSPCPVHGEDEEPTPPPDDAGPVGHDIPLLVFRLSSLVSCLILDAGGIKPELESRAIEDLRDAHQVFNIFDGKKKIVCPICRNFCAVQTPSGPARCVVCWPPTTPPSPPAQPAREVRRFEGIVRDEGFSRYLDCGGTDFAFQGLLGKRVRLTVEVLPTESERP